MQLEWKQQKPPDQNQLHDVAAASEIPAAAVACFVAVSAGSFQTERDKQNY